MIADLTDIQVMQAEFDKWLESNKKGINEKHIFQITKKQALSMISELYEVENELRLHKWWSNEDVNKENVLTELSDVLSYISSVANTIGIDLIIDEEITQVGDLESQFLILNRHMYESAYIQQKYFTKRKVITIFSEFINLVYSLGFSIKELKEAYMKKKKFNYKRFE